MSFTFVFFHKVKRILGNKRGYFVLIFFWISMEYIHLHWELAWPWLTLGNVFATIPEIVQWYEFTGVLGGSMWVLVINILLFIWWDSERIKKKLILPCTILLIPIRVIKYTWLVKLFIQNVQQFGKNSSNLWFYSVQIHQWVCTFVQMYETCNTFEFSFEKLWRFHQNLDVWTQIDESLEKLW